jgi:hypothetical protein
MARNKRSKEAKGSVVVKNSEKVKVECKRGNPRKILIRAHNCKGGKKREVLLLVTEENRNWGGSSRSNRLTNLTVIYVTNYQHVMHVLLECKLHFYDAVILAPSHGFQDIPKVKWRDKQGGTFISPCVLRAFRLANHVQICTCYQGKKYIECKYHETYKCYNIINRSFHSRNRGSCKEDKRAP